MMALDHGYQIPAQALPASTDRSSETPPRDMSDQYSRQGSSSPFSNYSSALFAPGDTTFLQEQQGHTDASEDDRYNARDPRRLTPNLGISFVSQIHTLKKELEGRDTVVGSLEEALDQSRLENEELSKDLRSQRAEVKSVKYQMSSLEHDMLKALEDIAQERDGALRGMADTRKQMEASKKKLRGQEDDINHTRSIWEIDKQEWEAEKRKMESKIHVVEERLKTMVAEMLLVHNTGQNRPGTANEANEGLRGIGAFKGNDSRSASRLSRASMDDTLEKNEGSNFRASRMSGLHEMGNSQLSGLSLADELEMTEDNESDADNDVYNLYSPDALPEEIHMISRRYSEDQKARKVMGFTTDGNQHFAEDENPGQHSMGIIEDYINFPGNQSASSYVDSGTQYSPIPPPAIQSKRTDSVSEKLGEPSERSANQSRKRVAIPSIFIEQNAASKPEVLGHVLMVSAGCQTDEWLGASISKETAANEMALPAIAIAKELKSTSTQTVEDTAVGPKTASTRLSSAPLDVPVIAIHPPASRPPSSHNSVVLPPRTRNAGCQAAIDLPRNMASTAMQTEEIRVDKRPVRVPPRLQPASLATKSSSRSGGSTEKRIRTAKSSISESSKHKAQRLPSIVAENTKSSVSSGLGRNVPNVSSRGTTENKSRPSSSQNERTYPRKNDNELLQNTISRSRSARPEISALGEDSKREDPKLDVVNDFSDDDEFIDAAPIRKTLSKVQNSWKLVPQTRITTLDNLASTSEDVENPNIRDEFEASESKAKDPPQSLAETTQMKAEGGHRRASNGAKTTDIRRRAMVSNGIAEHAQRARSPSVPSASGNEPPAVAPPFPVPTRSSSRKIPVSASDGAASPTPYSTSFFTARRGQDHGRPPIKRKILRKVQSAAAVSKVPEHRPPHPVPSVSASSTGPGSPRTFPPPQNQFILPYENVAKMPSRVPPIPQCRSHAGEASIEAPSQQTSVVDAIAQTMVGEWMWKYVRKRTSFGITENPQAEFEMGRNGETGNSSGVRHRRWVWLAPYENAVIWSSKQPTSGPALLGKGGRKLMIQSVLDVKDDTPLPKNAGSQSVFDRSILILTPQRALKFTAISRERHYIWLTALSFLSHSTRGMDDLASPPPVPPQEYQPPASHEASVSFRRTPVRDSIRVAKSRSRPSLGAHSFSSPIVEREQKVIQDTILMWGDREVDSEDAAEPPQVPRVAAHARKRSNTGPRPVPLSAFHSYPTNGTAMASSFSLQAPTSRDKYDRFMPRSRGASSSGPATSHTTMTHRTTDPSRDSYIAPPPVVPDNFFDPAGTMRMEAFVMGGDEKELPELSKVESSKAKKSYRTRQGRKKDLSYWGMAESTEGNVVKHERMKEEDPFTGF